jgi:hypothetical protein
MVVASNRFRATSPHCGFDVAPPFRNEAAHLVRFEVARAWPPLRRRRRGHPVLHEARHRHQDRD